MYKLIFCILNLFMILLHRCLPQALFHFSFAWPSPAVLIGSTFLVRRSKVSEQRQMFVNFQWEQRKKKTTQERKASIKKKYYQAWYISLNCGKHSRMTHCCDLFDIRVPIRLVKINGEGDFGANDKLWNRNFFTRMNNQWGWKYDICESDKVSFYSQEEA